MEALSTSSVISAFAALVSLGALCILAKVGWKAGSVIQR